MASAAVDAGDSMSRLRLLTGPRDFAYKVKNTQPAHLIQYLMLDEASGAVAYDRSGHGFNGAYSNVTLGQPGLGDSRTSAGFNGTTSYVDAYSAGLAAAFNPLECTVVAWGKIPLANFGRMVTLEASTNNRLLLYKPTPTLNTFRFAYVAGGTTVQVVGTDPTPITLSNGFMMACSISKSGDTIKGYINGVQNGPTGTGLGVWTGSLGANTTLIGALTKTPSAVWNGSIAHVAIWDVALSAAEILNLVPS